MLFAQNSFPTKYSRSNQLLPKTSPFEEKPPVDLAKRHSGVYLS